jgi:hypothetical protein
MFKSLNSTTLAAAFAATLLGGLVMATGESQASTSADIFKCRAFTKVQVVDCCERIVERKGLPFWMIDAHMNCNTGASCSKKKGSHHTYLAAAVIKPKLKCSYHAPKQGDGGTYTPSGGKGGYVAVPVLAYVPKP